MAAAGGDGDSEQSTPSRGGIKRLYERFSQSAAAYAAFSQRAADSVDRKLRTAEWAPAIEGRFTEMRQRIADAVHGAHGAETDPGDEESRTGFVGAVKQVDWEVVSDRIRTAGADLGPRIQELTAGVDWSRMKPHAKKLAIAVVVAIATEAAGDLVGSHASTLAKAVAGRSDVLADAATSVASAASTDVGARLTAQFVNSEVLKTAARLATDSHLRGLGVSWGG